MLPLTVISFGRLDVDNVPKVLAKLRLESPAPFPEKFADTLETLMSKGSLELFTVPVVILEAFIVEIPAPCPLKFAVTLTTDILEGNNELETVPSVRVDALDDPATMPVNKLPFPM